MWLSKKNRRYNQRYKIHREALLHYILPEHQATLNVVLEDISLKGALLQMNKLQAGPFHLLASDQSPRLILEISLPMGIVRQTIKIEWYRLQDKGSGFLMGVKFIDLSKETISILKDTINVTSK